MDHDLPADLLFYTCQVPLLHHLSASQRTAVCRICKLPQESKDKWTFFPNFEQQAGSTHLVNKIEYPVIDGCLDPNTL